MAIPVRDGARWLPGVFAALARQAPPDHELELLVADSGSTDGSVELAHAAGARVLELAPGEFHHAATRNRLMREARGEFVALLTQDAEPAGPGWLGELLGGFALGDDVALVCGPYLPRPDCPPLEAARLRGWFRSLSPDGTPRVTRHAADDPPPDPAAGFFTDANGCVRRAAWEAVPYPEVPYAEDHALALAMLRAGWATAYVPAAGVLHSHHYTPTQRLRRAFDDHRGLREIYDRREPTGPAHVLNELRGAAGVAWRGGRRSVGVLAAVGDQALALTGAILGSRADRLPPWLRRRLSLERRATFQPWAQRWT